MESAEVAAWPDDWPDLPPHTAPAVFRLVGPPGPGGGPPEHMLIGLEPFLWRGKWFVRRGTLYRLNTYPIEALPRPLLSVLSHAMTQPNYTRKRWFANLQAAHFEWVRAHGEPTDGRQDH